MTHVFCTQFEYSSVHISIHSYTSSFVHSFIENVSIIHLSISISRKAFQLCRDVEIGERRGLSVPDIAANQLTTEVKGAGTRRTGTKGAETIGAGTGNRFQVNTRKSGGGFDNIIRFE